MKKLLYSIFLLSCITTAQEFNQEDQLYKNSFKRWAIDVSTGVHKPTRPFVSGHVATPDLWQANIGLRYMFTRSFGLGLGLGYNNIENDSDSNIEFSNDYFRSSIEAYVNLANLVNLDRSTTKFGIMGHGGIGVGFLKSNVTSVDNTEKHLNFMAGIMPQYQISKNVGIYADLTIIGTTRNHYGWDGQRLTNEDIRGFEGMLINASLGLSFYLGKGDKPADFDIDPTDQKMAVMQNELDKLIRENADDDQDGVPNHLDRDNNTPSGVRVDSKGRALDLNKNGIPDDMESTLDGRYVTRDMIDKLINQSTNGKDGVSAKDKALIKKLINDGYVNVYFKFDSTTPTTYSLESINTIATYLKSNPNAKATITGYADELGNESYNKALSSKRAKMVYDVLIALGINKERMSHNGNGEDPSVDVSSEQARQLVRRVTFKVD